jgi:organic radical activating enzyme
MNQSKKFIEIKQTLDKVSPTFCIAKWKQVTLHLHNGHTHSCHHPTTHKIPLEELALNPSALHNTNYKKSQRKLMLEGHRPTECDYCWRVEDQNIDSLFSDRIYKSSHPWAINHLEEIQKEYWNHDTIPTYVEVNFGNACNFKCSYCNPNTSSQWMDEIVRYGPYPTSTKFNNLEYIKHNDLMPVSNKDINPYIDSFWKWWPKLYPKLETFRITGGEPLLNKNTFKVLNYIIDNPNPKLELGINTNLNPPDENFDRFLKKIKIIQAEKKVGSLKIYTSAEAYGAQAEYIRFGMNYKKWLENIHRIFNEIPGIQLTLMSTYNFLSVFSYREFLVDILEIKKTYGILGSTSPILLDIPYLRYPKHQSIFIIESGMLPLIEEQINFANNNLEDIDNLGFSQYEISKLIRILDLVKGHREDCIDDRKDLINFVDEHDRRRGTNFLKTFPQMQETYHKWKKL